MNAFCQRTVLVACVLCGLACGSTGFAHADDELPSDISQLDRQVAALIDELGADEFARRERAQAELERLGLVAFDALRAAQQHDDIEIALRAKYLVRRLQVRWFDDHDPPEVRRVLRDYGRQSENDRRSRMDRLASLSDGEGLPALCRLVRFESELRLAKYAALLILKEGGPTDGVAADERAAQLRQTIGLSRNPAAAWVKTFADTLEDPAASDAQWDALIAAEHDVLANFPEQTSPEILIDLLRWRAGALIDRQQRELAMPLIHRSLELLSAKREQILSAVDWLLTHQAYGEVSQVAERFPDLFGDTILLQYRLAEAQRLAGEDELAAQTAAAALATRADQFEEHVEAASGLQERGLFDWSEREFRQVMQLAERGSLHELRARFYLAEMLHDQLRDLAAAEVLKEVVDGMKTDAEYGKRVRALRGDETIDEIPARMHFFYAEHFAATDREKQKQHLLEGIASYPREIDLLIAMHRFPEADEQWKARVSQHIADTSGSYRDRIRQFNDTLQKTIGQPIEDDVRIWIARLNNQLAWLIANTEGDFDEALRCSKLSLEYVPETAGYLDTLGRCYYAKKDYANAVKYQARAAELDPHSGQIQRQLELFQRALEQSQAAQSEAAAPASAAPAAR